MIDTSSTQNTLTVSTTTIYVNFAAVHWENTIVRQLTTLIYKREAWMPYLAQKRTQNVVHYESQFFILILKETSEHFNTNITRIYSK